MLQVSGFHTLWGGVGVLLLQHRKVCVSYWGCGGGTCWTYETNAHYWSWSCFVPSVQKSKEKVSEVLFHPVLDLCFPWQLRYWNAVGQSVWHPPLGWILGAPCSASWDWCSVHGILLYICHEYGLSVSLITSKHFVHIFILGSVIILGYVSVGPTILLVTWKARYAELKQRPSIIP